MCFRKIIVEKIAFFDLETQWSFQDLIPNYRNMTWKQKEIAREKVITKLKIAFAGVIFCDLTNKTDLTKIYSEENLNTLFTDLKDIELIVGHNVLRFDYRILSSYVKNESLIADLKERTLDIMLRLQKLTGQMIGLDDLGKLNLGITKAFESFEIPKMWREGKHEDVIKHLKHDLMITKSIFEHVNTNKKIQYTKKSYGKVIGIKSVSLDWDINNH